jgi:glutamyl-tRNA reductase
MMDANLDAFHALSLDLRRCSPDLAARLAMDGTSFSVAVERLRGQTDEALLLTTCHRTELYLVPRAGGMGPSALLSELTGVGTEEFLPVATTFQGTEAARHLLRVASGLESSVIGEHEVLGQLGDSLAAARERGLAGPVLERLGPAAVRLGRRARAETGIAASSVSLAGAAIELASERLGSLQGARAVVIGSGQMAARLLPVLAARRPATITLVARNSAARDALAAQFGATPAGWDELEARVAGTDAVFCAVGSRAPILDLERLRPAPRLVVDLGAPPNTSIANGVERAGLDEVTTRAERNLGTRRESVAIVENMLDAALAAEVDWFAARGAIPLIRALRERAETVRDEELERALRRLAHLADRDREVVSALAHRLVNKLLHGPVASLKEPGAVEELGQEIEEAFALHADD